MHTHAGQSMAFCLFCARNFLHFTILLNVYFMHFWPVKYCYVRCVCTYIFGCDRILMLAMHKLSSMVFGANERTNEKEPSLAVRPIRNACTMYV